MTNVRVESVTAGYGGPPVLTDINLDVNSGEFVAILGSSGSGKTTLLRVIAGFLKPTSGSVHFGDREVSGSKVWIAPENRHVGIVPQEGALFPHLDVRGNVSFGLKKSSDSPARVNEVLDMVGMSEFANARPQELSGGQQQRVALARALAPRPDVLLLDEPFTALDAGLRVTLRNEVRDLLTSLSTTSIMVTHDQEEALSIADRVAVMRGGKLVQFDAPTTLYQHPHDLEVSRFVGDSVELSAQWSNPETVLTPLGELTVQTSRHVAEPIIAVVRPEQLILLQGTKDTNGTVKHVVFHGHDSLVEVQLKTGELVTIRVPGAPTCTPGTAVSVQARGAASIYPAG